MQIDTDPLPPPARCVGAAENEKTTTAETMAPLCPAAPLQAAGVAFVLPAEAKWTLLLLLSSSSYSALAAAAAQVKQARVALAG